ncbi:SGNH/GDSL hydrolase family protein [uncultured Gimesia sp.]|uniref:SGNH/GDSL hydrolase family protein n=1 Tax=uncultured Gimesia sp. TaxID=1678688 RepID=UPI0026251109|nr:SGNH/GDSL hydrolase family protein [uncultured Gimesia sp.]
MNSPRLLIRISFLLLLSALPAAAAEKAKSLQLTLPPTFYAVPGVEMNIYYDNIVLTETPEKYRFEVSCKIGKAEQDHWTITPTASDVGPHPLSVKVTDANGTILGTAKTILHVSAANSGSKRDTYRLLIIGDSLTHATTYSNKIAELLSTSGNPKWQMLGTHKPKSAAAGVAHEGYGGWTWQRFAAHYEPNPDGTYRKRSSPFVYLGKDGKPGLDFKRYFKEECNGNAPGVVIIKLGINDCFSAKQDAIDAKIDGMFSQADILIKALQAAAPQAEIGICLTTPGNSRQEAFFANYKDRYSRWGWKKIQHRLVQRQIEKFAGREKQNLFIVPTELNLDIVNGYPVNNGVHPNTVGYQQIGDSIYSWLKYRLEE